MKQRLTRGHGIPISVAFWGVICGVAYILCVASYVVPGWSVVELMYP